MFFGMVLGYTRLLRRTMRREADTEYGQACIGCPHSKQCGAKKGACTCGDKK